LKLLKVLIADDEPKIRRGLKNSIDWNALGFEIAGEAENGEIALKLAYDLQPEIMLVDICMPLLNGLDLIERLKEAQPELLVIVITGHDEFAFAQQAIHLKVFDYLLKPVVKNQLYDIMLKAKEFLTQSRLSKKQIHWASTQLKKSLPYLKERFLNDWINEQLTEQEVAEQLEFLQIKIERTTGLLLIRTYEKCVTSEIHKEMDRQLLLYAVQNIIEEALKDWEPNAIFRDLKDNIVVVTPIKQFAEWCLIGLDLSARVEKHSNHTVFVIQDKIENGIAGLPCTYQRLLNEIMREDNWTPVVMLIKKHIDTNYSHEELTLQNVADEFKISPAYLSKLLRQELGSSFIDYLTQVRIRKAIMLLEDPFIKMYEVAEKVGYNSQHYFSTAFKKVMGISPLEYKKGGGR
jgi:two-component system response regulator YesN